MTLASGAIIAPNTTGRVAIFNGTANGTVDAILQDGSVTNTLAVNKLGTGTWTFTGANTYTLATQVQNGTLEFNTIGNVGATSSALGAPATVANATIALGATTTTGALRYIGLTNTTTDRVINLAGTTGGGALESSGTGTITYTSNLTATGVGSKSLALAGTNTGNNTIGGIIPDNGVGNTTALIKNGIGTWVLGGANTYSGGTTLNQGTLTVDTAGSLGATTGRFRSTTPTAPLLERIPSSTSTRPLTPRLAV